MTEKVKSTEYLEAVLKEIEPELPFGVHYLGPHNESTFRYSTESNSPKEPAPNPMRQKDLWLNDTGFYPLIAYVELFRPIQGRYGGWLYTVHFIVDDLLTAEEVRRKILRAAATLATQRGKTCTWKAYEDELDRIEREGFPEERIAN